MKKPIDIEQLVSWAYFETLKQPVGGLTGWEKLIYLGTMVEEGEREVALPVALGPPHPDALQIEHAVRKLEPVRIQWPAARAVLAPDIGRCVDDRDPKVAGMEADPSYLVRHHAIMENRPTWNLGPHRFVRTQGRNGKHIVEGVTAGRRYADGAHCPLQIDPAAADIISARLEYLAWHSALVMLARESWNLQDHEARPPLAPQAPWLSGPQRTPRILPTITPNRKTSEARTRVNV